MHIFYFIIVCFTPVLDFGLDCYAWFSTLHIRDFINTQLQINKLRAACVSLLKYNGVLASTLAGYTITVIKLKSLKEIFLVTVSV